MTPAFYKNEYYFKKLLKDFVRKNPVGSTLRPVLASVFRIVEAYLPQPRDFLIRSFPPESVGVEIGVYSGDFSERIFRLGAPSRLYLVDPWQAIAGSSNPKYAQDAQDSRLARVKERLARQIAAGRAVVLRKTSDEAANDIPDDSLDFVYIDGDHSYEQVAKDLENFYPKIRPRGILAGDDYHKEEVRRAVDDFSLVMGKEPILRNRQFIFRVD